MNPEKSYIIFNEQAEEFLLKMIKTFPSEQKTRDMKFYFDIVRQTDKRKPVSMFMENLEPYGLQIMSKDEEFFMKDQYVNAVESMSGRMGLIGHWSSLGPETKNSIWSYFQVLYVLGMQTFNKKEELKQILDQVHNKTYDHTKI